LHYDQIRHFRVACWPGLKQESHLSGEILMVSVLLTTGFSVGQPLNFWSFKVSEHWF
jgi:hypothetical protein